MAAEPHPRDRHFSAKVERHLCVYGGDLDFGESSLHTNFHMFSCDAEKWREIVTSGIHPPSKLRNGTCTSNDHCVFLHGGHDGEQHYSTLYQLDCRDHKWTQLSSAGDWGAPMAKRGHGMVYHAHTSSLLVFGGRSPQPGRGEVFTNEIHMFSLQEGKFRHCEIILSHSCTMVFTLDEV